MFNDPDTQLRVTDYRDTGDTVTVVLHDGDAAYTVEYAREDLDGTPVLKRRSYGVHLPASTESGEPSEAAYEMAHQFVRQHFDRPVVMASLSGSAGWKLAADTATNPSYVTTPGGARLHITEPGADTTLCGVAYSRVAQPRLVTANDTPDTGSVRVCTTCRQAYEGDETGHEV